MAGPNDADKQTSIRAVTGTALDYNGDWSALFDAASITAGDFNGRQLAWLNLRLGSTYTSLPEAQNAYAVAQGFTNWSAMGTFDPVYMAAAVTYFNAMPTQPTAQVKGFISTFIAGLMTDGLWTKIDGGNILCNNTAGQSYIDFKRPTRVATLSGTPTFTSYRGFTGTATLAEYVDTTFVPAVSGVAYLQNSAHIGVWVRNNIQSAGTAMGVSTGASAYILPRNLADGFVSRINDATNATVAAVVDSSGFSSVVRTGASATQAYKNGAALGAAGSAASTQLPTGTIKYLNTAVGGTSGLHQVAFGCYGGGLDATQAANLYSRVNTLVTALTAL